MASTALERIALEVSRVLVISPNDEFRAKVANRVASDSCVVDEATGGAAALAQADECAYATALLDRRLVDLNADEVLTALQKQQPNIRVVFIDSEHQE
ncbi:MAG: response regulator, partial [Candidatus Acidiferrales bacterium]